MTFLKFLFLLLIAFPFAIFLLFILDKLMDELKKEIPAGTSGEKHLYLSGESKRKRRMNRKQKRKAKKTDG